MNPYFTAIYRKYRHAGITGCKILSLLPAGKESSAYFGRRAASFIYLTSNK
jgi:hypothetical protein